MLRDRNTLQIDTHTATRRLADLHHVRRQTVREVDHRRGDNLRLGQRIDDIDSRLGFQLTLQQILIPLEFGLRIGHTRQRTFLAFEQVQAHICRTQVARNAHQIIEFRTTTISHLRRLGRTHCRNANGKARQRGGRIATNKIDIIVGTRAIDALVELIESLDRHLARHGDRDHHLLGAGIHRQNIAHTHHHSFIAEVFERKVGQIEVDSLHQHIGRGQLHATAADIRHRSVVTHATKRRGTATFEIRGQVIDQSEFAERGYFGQFFVTHSDTLIWF